MRKVWLLITEWDDSECVHSAYDSAEKAQDAKAKLEDMALYECVYINEIWVN